MTNALDCRGLQCPEPVTRCRAILEEQNPPILDVRVDNSAALENVSRFLSRRGYTVETNQLASNDWHIRASKSGPDLASSTVTDGGQPEDCGKTLVLLTTETLGRGDDALGAKLMNNFLASHTELGDSLWRIILLNGAVKLSARPGDALQHLQTLHRAGVSILVCGTCLMHYGLLEKKQVGETTNMMDVVSSMALAQKIIRP